MGKRRAWICVFLFTLQAINYAARVALSVVAKPVASDLALSPVAMGYLLSSFLWSYLLCLIPMGILVDRYGSKIIIGAGIAIWSLATVLTGGAWNVGTLIAMRLVMGLGEASTHPAGARVVREWIPASERGMANAIFISGSYAGPALGAMLAAWISDMAGWRTAFFVVGAIGFGWLGPIMLGAIVPSMSGCLTRYWPPICRTTSSESEKTLTRRAPRPRA